MGPRLWGAPLAVTRGAGGRSDGEESAVLDASGLTDSRASKYSAVGVLASRLAPKVELRPGIGLKYDIVVAS
jgi:hypothetical protein